MIWEFILEKIRQNVEVYLITVAETIGSSPGKVGFKMAVASDNSLYGSVGGGVMEHQLVEIARESLAKGFKHNFMKRQVHSHEAEEDKSGMICSGEQTQIFSYICKTDVNTVLTLIKLERENHPGKVVLTSSGIEVFEGESHITFKNIDFQKNDTSYRYSEPIGLKETVYIFGAGHISVPLSQILNLLEFRVEVFDNRKNLNTFESNTFASKKQIVDFKNVGSLVAENDRSYVVIMTYGHKFDELVLKQMLNKRIKYLGMIGSKSKVKAIFENLIAEGYSKEKVERVCSPIGLPIGGQTPAEIAVSIAAQIVEWRNKH